VISISCKEEEIVKIEKKDYIRFNNKFAVNLFHNLTNNNNENIFISPYSISTALAMTYGGAKGETKKQMQKTLFFPQNENVLNKSFQYLIKDINKFDENNDNIKLKTVNAIWVENNFEVQSRYDKLVRSYYFSEVNRMDFINTPEVSRNIINNSISKNTGNKIKNLIPKDLISKETRLILTNAIYFLADWEKKFNKKYTKKTTFHLLNGENTEIKMMNQTGKFRYTEDEKMQTIELPYVNERLSMMVFLPKENDLENIDSFLTENRLYKTIKDMKYEKIKLFLPKFKITYFSSLNDVLKKMGMKDAFTERADFTGINKNKSEKLMISNVLHKAFVDVSEEGTEATASTAVIMKLTSAPPTQKPIVFRADHPFVFIIFDKENEQILFIGRLTNFNKEGI